MRGKHRALGVDRVDSQKNEASHLVELAGWVFRRLSRERFRCASELFGLDPYALFSTIVDRISLPSLVSMSLFASFVMIFNLSSAFTPVMPGIRSLT